VTTGAVADAVLFLLSERAASITGQTLTIDAGSLA
jgi:enoyl-[acyl-carrier-protein] reductase (NADH)